MSVPIIIKKQSMSNLRELLLKTYTETSNQQRKLAEQLLHQLQFSPGLVEELTLIIQTDEREDLRTSAATYFVKFVRDVVGRQQTTQPQLREACQAILGILELDIGLQYKIRIATSLQFLLDKLGKPFRHELVNDLLKSVTEQASAQKLSLMKCQQLCLVGRLLIVNSREDFAIGDKINQLLSQIVCITDKLFEEARVEAPKAQLKWLTLLKNLFHTIKTAFRVVKFERIPDIIRLTFEARLEVVVQKTLTLKLNLNEEDALFSPEAEKDSSLLNSIKENAVAIFDSVVRILIKYVPQPPVQSINPFIVKISFYLKLLVEGLVKQLELCPAHLIRKEETKDLMESVLKAIIFLTTCPNYLDYFQKHRSVLYHSIVCGLLRLDQNDELNFHQNPTEFMESVIFTVTGGLNQNDKDGNHSDLTLRALASQLLSNLCRYQDGFVSDLFQGIIAKLSLPNCPDKPLLLMQLSIAEIHILERPDMLISIKKYLEAGISEMLMQQQATLSKKQEMDAFFLYFLVYSYTKSIDGVDNTFAATFSAEVAVRVLNGSLRPCNESSQLLCLQILSKVSETNSLAVYQMSPQVLRILTKRLPYPLHSDKILDHLSHIIVENCDILAMTPESIIECVGALVAKILEVVSSSDPNRLVITKCWNCIRTIVDVPSFKFLIEKAEEQVRPLTNHLGRDSPVSFDQDIVLLTSACIRRTQSVSLGQLAIFQQFPKLFEKNKYRFLQLFECINLFLTYGAEPIRNSQPALRMVLEMCLKALFVQAPKVINESDNCEGALILQNLILNCGTSFTPEFWRSILENMGKRLKMRPLRYVFLTSNIVVVMAMCLSNAVHVIEPGLAYTSIETILMNLQYFVQDYPSKVFSVALINILRQYTQPAVKGHMSHILDCVTTLLRVNYGRSLAEEELRAVEEQTQAPDEQDHKISMSMFTCRLKELDEYEQFKNGFRALRSEVPDLVQVLVSDLIPEKQQYLKTILGLTKVGERGYRTILQVKRPTV